jgi:hypothetical protein
MPDVNQPVVETPLPVEEKKDQVSYESHKKLLDEKKRVQEEKEALTLKLKEIEENKLKEESRYKELFESRENELKAIKEQSEKERKALTEHRKLEAFLKEVGGVKKESYVSLIDTDKIIVESDGSLNKTSLQDYVKSFKEQFPELIKSVDLKSDIPSKEPIINGTNTQGMKSKDILAQLYKR